MSAARQDRRREARAERAAPSVHFHADAQRHVLGAALASPEARRLVLARLTDDDLYGEPDRRVLRTIRKLEAAGRCSVITVAEALPELSDEVHADVDCLGTVSDVALSVGVVKRDAAKRALVEKLTAASAGLAGANGDLSGAVVILREAATVAEKAQSGLAEAEGHQRPRSYTAPEVAAMVFPHPDPVLLWAELGTILDVAGKSKHGKTTLILLAGRAVLRNEPFLDMPTVHMPVLCLTEQTRKSFQKKLKKMGLAGEADLHVLFRSDFPGLSWAEICDFVTKEVSRLGIGLLIIDTLSDWAKVIDENDAAEALRVMDPLRSIAEQNVLVVTVRHAGKGDHKDKDVVDIGRGSSAFSGLVDTACVFEMAPGQGHPNRRQLRFRSRDDEAPPNLVIELREGCYVALGSESNIEFKAAHTFLLRQLPSCKEHAMSERDILINGLGAFSRSSLKRVLNGEKGKKSGLIWEGVVAREKGAGSAASNGYGYWLAGADQSAAAPEVDPGAIADEGGHETDA